MQEMLVKDKQTLRVITDMYHTVACSLVTSLTTYESFAFFLNYPVLLLKGRVTLLPSKNASLLHKTAYTST